MMVFCPKDGNYCIDDLCHGGSCLLGGGEPFRKCPDCGHMYTEFGGHIDCECEPEDFECYSCGDIGCHKCLPHIPKEAQDHPSE